ncbi:MAG TPA: M36 family metallopeptidase [Candidatus Binatia bacterium]|jgi:extracellular elastinolytic metalloproteinase
MAREIDRRDSTINNITPAREAELRSVASAVSDRLPGAHRIHITGFDARTGNPAAVVSDAAPAETGNYVQRALDHVRNIGRALGLTATQPAEFAADPDIQRTSSGAVAVHLQQHYKSIPVFQAAETVRFAPNGTIKETAGSSISIAREIAISPRLTVQQAVMKAAEYVAVPHADEHAAKDEFGQPLKLTQVDLSGFEPKIIATFADKADRPTMLEAGPFGDKIRANLLWFLLNGDLRLTWEVIITMPNYEEQYRILVDGENGEILYCRQLVQHILARGNVYRVDGGSARQMTDFPRPLADYGLPIPNDLPSDFPDHWVEGNRTVGNSVDAHLGANGPESEGSSQGGVLTFNPSSQTGDDQKVVNILYFNCFMHDYFYLLGFREVDGNFQRDNLGRGGLQSDRVDARAHSGAVNGTANMATPPDGSNPIMNMGLVEATNRHTAFDSSVVFHEFTHGVTNRLVGGPANASALEDHQSGGMGEGWSDYIACTINSSTVVGDWVINDSGGIRDFPYNSNFPDNFGKLGTGRYSGFTPQGRRWPHPIGEIWCATLLEMNRNIGPTLGVQLVVDALKLTPANPSFLDARDAILAALNAMLDGGKLTAGEHDIARRGIWKAFAKFGMGPSAQSNGASLSGIVADFNMPTFDEPEQSESDVRVETTPNQQVPDNQPAGISSVLMVPQSGRIGRVTVSVDIEHTFIGDLQVSVTTPAGKTAVLHNRSGSSTDNLIKSYSNEGMPSLQALLGEEAQGDWTLKVADLASQDNGRLRRWGLEMDLDTSTQLVQGEAIPALSIPDNDPTGVSSNISIAQSGSAQRIKVGVDIAHTFIGDLRVELVSPSGQQALLHDRFGGGEDNLIRIYDSLLHPALATLTHQPIEGNWELRVKDLAGRDVGKFNKWSLELAL